MANYRNSPENDYLVVPEKAGLFLAVIPAKAGIQSFRVFYLLCTIFISVLMATLNEQTARYLIIRYKILQFISVNLKRWS